MGAILPAVVSSKKTDNLCLYFIADLHSLTTIKDASLRRDHTVSTAAAWLACGLDTQRHLLYRQSRLPQVCELSWYLSCFTPYPMLANAHAFKERKKQLSEISAGLFAYPVLMAADILLYQAQYVPVGKDQQQHLEIARDIATSFNHRYGDTFVLPEAVLPSTQAEAILGTDGKKMSKSYDNTVDIFLPEPQLRKQIMRIRTDSLPVESSKTPDSCLVYKLSSLVAPREETQEMRSRYIAGGYGYGEAKEALFRQLLRRFSSERQAYKYYTQHPQEIEAHLQAGEEKASLLAQKTLQKVRRVLGLN